MTDTTDTTATTTAVRRRTLLKGAAGAVLAGGVVTGAATRSEAATAAPTGPLQVTGLANFTTTDLPRPYRFQRRAVGVHDVRIDIRYSAVCHSDIHTAHGDWGQQRYPLVTGHEMAGVVTAVGSSVTQHKAGDRVGVGTMVDSCGRCDECRAGFENYCENVNTQAYGSPVPSYGDPADYPGGYTQGGYSTAIVVRDHFAIPIPEAISLQQAGPLMCAGITVWSPLQHWEVRPGSRVAVLGVGGLGHLGIQLANAMGAEVVAFTTTPGKARDARRFGARDVVVNQAPAKMTQYARHFDFILDTIPYQHPLGPYVPLLKRGATLCRVGVGEATTPNQYPQMSLVMNQTSLAGSNTGGIRETRDLLAFAAAHDVRPQVQVVPARQVRDAWPSVVAKRARYRYVLDMSDLT